MQLNTTTIITITDKTKAGDTVRYRVESSDFANSQTYIVDMETGNNLTIDQAKKHFALLGEALKIAESNSQE